MAACKIKVIDDSSNDEESDDGKPAQKDKEIKRKLTGFYPINHIVS
jgi:hypothetical protein